MTEVEWLACANGLEALDALPNKLSLRKMRLLACACARRFWPTLAEAARASLVVAEKYADGQANRADLRQVRGPYYSGVRADNCASLAASPSQGFRKQLRGVLAQGVSVASTDEDGWVRRRIPDKDASENAAQATLARDLFGKPFRLVPFGTPNRTPTVVSLAQAAYDERHLPSGELDLHRLAVLADALEEAGAPGELLAHLRGPGPHVRGCHVVDLCLGLN
jgi:hypothetical protein